MKILVTGATGFIGRHLIESFVRQGKLVKCLVRESSNAKFLEELGVEVAYCDLLNDSSLKKNIKDKDISTIYHLAGKVYSRNKNDLYRVNYEGTRNIFNACLGTQINKFVFLSSLAVLGPTWDERELDEETKPHPITDYGRSKYSSESYILDPTHKNTFSVCIVRAPLVYGVGMSRKSRLYSVLRMATSGFLVNFTKKNTQFPLCHLENLLDLFQIISEEKRSCSNIYHIRDDTYYDLYKIKELLENVLNRKIVTIHIPQVFRKILMVVPSINKDLVKELGCDWTLSISKIKREFNFFPKEKFQESLPPILQSFDLM